MNGGNRLEEPQRIFHRQIQYLGDIEVLETDFQRFPVVSLALADITGDIDVGQKMHLDLGDAIPLARLTSASANVEAESARLVTTRPRFLSACEQLANRREDPRVRCWIRTRGAANRALVDIDAFIELF